MSYQPPGGLAAPDYGRPPKKSRAGLFIALMLVLLVAILGTGVWVTTKVVADLEPKGTPPTPKISVAPPPRLTASVKPKPKPTTPVKTVPVKPVPITPLPPAPTGAAQVAAQFVTRVNANDAKGTTALGCADVKQAISSQFTTFVRRPAALTVSKTPVSSAGPIAVFSLGGTMQGSAASGILVLEVATQPCVKSFAVH